MLDRIVPVHRTDLLSLYHMVVYAKEDKLYDTIKTQTPGVFEEPASLDSGGFYSEPVKKAVVRFGDDPDNLYFVPAFDFDGFYDEDGNKLEVGEGSAEVKPDGSTLYVLSASGSKLLIFPFASIEN